MAELTFADGLRELADWMDAHPEVNIAPFEVLHYCLDKDEFRTSVRAMGRGEKSTSDPYFFVTRWFGPVALRTYAAREKVCRRVVKGVELVPKEIVPAKVVPAHSREIVEWECEPILAAERRVS
ncbi:MAG: hypothetical protein NUW01_01645 [Gemmatimonadaceae bacterium]|nr:hypothetical protein [Gemmatimonadaceae bacterium]